MAARRNNRNLTNILLFAAVVLLAVVAFLVGALWQKINDLEKTKNTSVAANPNTNKTPEVTLDQVKSVFIQDVIKFGDTNRKLLVVEFADPSCPYCHAAAGLDPEVNSQIGPNFKLVSQGGSYVAPVPEFKKLVDEGKAAFAYVYFPGHQNGDMAMKALYCASETGKFWEAHDKLMTNAGYKLINDQVKNDKTKSGLLANFLSGVVSYKEMKDCLDSGKYDAHLTQDQAIAGQFGVSGTPTFIVNTTRYPGAFDYNTARAAISSQL